MFVSGTFKICISYGRKFITKRKYDGFPKYCIISSDKPKRKPAIKKLEQIVCPICGKGHIIKGKTAYGCSEYQNGCTFRVSFDEYSETMTPAQLNKRINLKYKKND